MAHGTVAPGPRGADVFYFEHDMHRLLNARKERILTILFDELPAIDSRGKELEILMKMISVAESAIQLLTWGLPLMERLQPDLERRPKWVVWLRIYLLVALGLFFLSLAYWFSWGLPARESARLQLERERFEIEKERSQQDDAKRHACADQAEAAYWQFVELNGRRDAKSPTIWSAERSVWDNARAYKESIWRDCLVREGLRSE